MELSDFPAGGVVCSLLDTVSVLPPPCLDDTEGGGGIFLCVFCVFVCAFLCFRVFVLHTNTKQNTYVVNSGSLG